MSQAVKYFYKGEHKDFVIFVESEEIVENYLKDSTIPLVDVVGVFKVYNPETKRGSDGVLEESSKTDLENEFGSKSTEEIIQFILKNGTNKNNSNVSKKGWGSTNDSNGVRA